MIEVDRLTKRYGVATILRDVTVTIPEGGVTALVGPNGAGKSTLLSIIGRLTPADGGAIRVDGMDVTRTPSRVLARHLAILRQDNAILARISVRDLIGFGRFPHNGGVPGPEDRDRIEAAMEEMSLRPLADRFLDELSGGQRQRAFIAMTLCQDTRYLLLDEPLNSLDLQHAVAIMRRLRHIARDLGRTVLVVLHDLHFAAAFSDRIIALKAGQLVFNGPTADMMHTGILSDIYGTPIRVEEVGGRRLPFVAA